MSDQIDPIQFGELRADMRNMKSDMAKIIVKMDELTDLANKSKGAFWAGMIIASIVGGALSWLAAQFHLKIGV